MSLSDQHSFRQLWRLFATKNYTEMQKYTPELLGKYSFIKETIGAIGNMNAVEQQIMQLYEKDKNFGDFFKQVRKNYAIYGYGDLQIKYLLGELNQ